MGDKKMGLTSTKRRIRVLGEVLESEIFQLDEKDAEAAAESAATGTCTMRKVNEAQKTKCYAEMTRTGPEIPTMVIINPGEPLKTLEKATKCAKSVGSDVLYVNYLNYEVELEPPLYICEM